MQVKLIVDVDRIWEIWLEGRRIIYPVVLGVKMKCWKERLFVLVEIIFPILICVWVLKIVQLFLSEIVDGVEISLSVLINGFICVVCIWSQRNEIGLLFKLL